MAVSILQQARSVGNPLTVISDQFSPGRLRSHPTFATVSKQGSNPYSSCDSIGSHFKDYTVKQSNNFIQGICASRQVYRQKRERSHLWIAPPISRCIGRKNRPLNNKSPPWLLPDFDVQQQSQRGQKKMFCLTTVPQTPNRHQSIQSYYRLCYDANHQIVRKLLVSTRLKPVPTAKQTVKYQRKEYGRSTHTDQKTRSLVLAIASKGQEKSKKNLSANKFSALGKTPTPYQASISACHQYPFRRKKRPAHRMYIITNSDPERSGVPPCYTLSRQPKTQQNSETGRSEKVKKYELNLFYNYITIQILSNGWPPADKDGHGLPPLFGDVEALTLQPFSREASYLVDFALFLTEGGTA